MKKLWVFSNDEFNDYMRSRGWGDGNLPGGSAFVSICTPKWNPEYDDSHWFSGGGAVINLDFDDIDDYYMDDVDGNRMENVAGMDDGQADALFDFIEANAGRDFYVHCSAGKSRSQGVARFMLDFYPEHYGEGSLRPENPCLTPNSHVTRLLKRCWMRRHLDGAGSIEWEKE